MSRSIKTITSNNPAADKKHEEMVFIGRKLLDEFGDSLRFVNRLFTVEFGSEQRKVA